MMRDAGCGMRIAIAKSQSRLRNPMAPFQGFQGLPGPELDLQSAGLLDVAPLPSARLAIDVLELLDSYSKLGMCAGGSIERVLLANH